MTRRTSWVPRRGYPGRFGGRHFPEATAGEIVTGGRTHPDNDDCSERDDGWAYFVDFSEIILLIYYGCE